MQLIQVINKSLRLVFYSLFYLTANRIERWFNVDLFVRECFDFVINVF